MASAQRAQCTTHKLCHSIQRLSALDTKQTAHLQFLHHCLGHRQHTVTCGVLHGHCRACTGHMGGNNTHLSNSLAKHCQGDAHRGALRKEHQADTWNAGLCRERCSPQLLKPVMCSVAPAASALSPRDVRLPRRCCCSSSRAVASWMSAGTACT